MYVITATVLELYWMHPTIVTVPTSDYSAERIQQSQQLQQRPGQQPQPQQQQLSPPPPAASSPPPTPATHDAAQSAAKKKSRRSKKPRHADADAESPPEKSVSMPEHAAAAAAAAEPPDAGADSATVASATASAVTAAAATPPRSRPPPAFTAGRRGDGKCWQTPRPFFEAPFDESFASVVWARPTSPTSGPLEDIPEAERRRDWPKDKVARLERILPSRSELASRRYDKCAVVGSSPELLLYRDGKAIDGHDAVFRANLAVTEGWEEYVGRRTTVRVVNPVESIRRARSKGDAAMAIIKNQDPPAIRSPSREHGKFLGEAEAQPAGSPNFLARRSAIELCNFMLLASTLDGSDGAAAEEMLEAVASAAAAAGKKRSKKQRAAAAAAALNMSSLSARFRAYASGASLSWHPMGDTIPRFSPIHCSTGTVLLVQALLTCKSVSLYGYHSCSCAKKCADSAISERNHYWDKKETPRFGEMMSRYEHHMHFYQRLENACDLDFQIARKDHCDAA